MAEFDPIDEGFLDARRDLIEVASFMDQAPPHRRSDPRLAALQEALHLVQSCQEERTAALLNFFSDQVADVRDQTPGWPVQGVAPPVE